MLEMVNVSNMITENLKQLQSIKQIVGEIDTSANKKPNHTFGQVKFE